MRIILRILAVLTAAVLSVIIFALDQAAKVYSLIAGWFYILLALCAVMAIIGQNWIGLGLLGGMFAFTMVVFVLAAVITGFLEDIKDGLLGRG